MKKTIFILLLVTAVSAGKRPALGDCVIITKGLYTNYMGWVVGSDCHPTSDCNYYIIDVYAPGGGCIAKNKFYYDNLRECTDEDRDRYKNASSNSNKSKNTSKLRMDTPSKANSDWINSTF